MSNENSDESSEELTGENSYTRRWIPLQKLAPEEEEKVRNFFKNSELSDDEDSSDEYNSDSDYAQYEGESDFDEPGSESGPIQDISTMEYENSYEEFRANYQRAEGYNSFEDDEIDEIVAIEPNRGQKYVGQGKNDKTIWWSMPCQREKERTVEMKQVRSESFAYCKELFGDKKIYIFCHTALFWCRKNTFS